jgi:hypothetical protein
LFTTKALAFLESKIPGRNEGLAMLFDGPGRLFAGNQAQVVFNRDGSRLATSGLGSVRLWDTATGRLVGGWSGMSETFVRIGHSLIALIAAVVGGQFSRRLYGTERESALEPARPQGSSSPVGTED